MNYEDAIVAMVDDAEMEKKLKAFEQRVAEAFEAKRVKGPVHLSGGNERELIGIFKKVGREDWVFSTYRSHYHALLHGLDPEWLFAEICSGRSMDVFYKPRRFYSSAMVGGCLPIATGVAAAIKRKGEARRVWCFVGDMAATTGAFHESVSYAEGHDLPIRFVVEDNGLSVGTPTTAPWGAMLPERPSWKVERYRYRLTYPHTGIGKWVVF